MFWKIDYYNDKLTYYEDPLSGGCKRVMTPHRAKLRGASSDVDRRILNKKPLEQFC